MCDSQDLDDQFVVLLYHQSVKEEETTISFFALAVSREATSSDYKAYVNA